MQIDDTADDKHPLRTCEGCGKPFRVNRVRPDRPLQRFCSRACRHAWWRIAMQPKMSDAGAMARWGTPVHGQPDPVRSDDDRMWAERGRLWSQTVVPVEVDTPGPVRLRRGPPIVVAGHGARFNIEHGALVIRNGFTHYPHTPEIWRIYPGEMLPARIVICDADGSISFDVLTWCATRDIPIVWLTWQAEVVTVAGDPGLSRDVDLARAQLRLIDSGQALAVATDLIRKKLEGQRETLAAFPDLLTPAVDRFLTDTRDSLETDPPETPEALRWREAQAAKAYFTAWRALPLRWKGTSRHPISATWNQIGPRLSSITGTARHATHPVNALLNYAYGMLESQVRRAIILAGLDPTLGVLHVSQPGRRALVYDLMEPLRPRVDRKVLTFLTEHTFHPKDLIREANGVCRVHPQLARTIAQLSSAMPLSAVTEGFIHQIRQPM
jgi:CRISPR-associated endonuclease Cas1